MKIGKLRKILKNSGLKDSFANILYGVNQVVNNNFAQAKEILYYD